MGALRSLGALQAFVGRRFLGSFAHAGVSPLWAIHPARVRLPTQVAALKSMDLGR